MDKTFLQALKYDFIAGTWDGLEENQQVFHTKCFCNLFTSLF